MDELAKGFTTALQLIGGFDRELMAIVGLSLQVSLTASCIAFVIGAPFGAFLAMQRFHGRGAIIVIVNALLGLPPVVVGLFVYLMPSRSGPLGTLGLLFTPNAMIVAQAILGTPIVAALVHRSLDPLWRNFGDSFIAAGASRPRSGVELLRMGRGALLTAFLAAFGRAIAEVGAILIVGGNIRGYTRTMTTTIALETSKGELALALGLGLVLIMLSLAVSTIAFAFERATRRV